MDFIIEQLPVQSTIYMRRTGAYGSENYKLMAALKEWANRKGLFEDSIIYGIAHDNENTLPEKCRYDVCLVAAADCPVDDSVQRGEIPSGKYAVFTILHTAEAVQEFWASIIQVLQNEGLQFDTTRPILERYKHGLVEDGKCEFCIPLTDGYTLNENIVGGHEMTEDTKYILDKLESMDKKMESMDKKLEEVQKEVRSTQLTLENETNKNIQIIAKEHYDLTRTLDEALKVEKEKEMLLIRVNRLENELRKLKERIEDIA